MHAKLQVAGFQNKRDIRHRSLDFVCLFLLEHLLVQVTWWNFASDDSEIQASVKEFKFTSNICYLLSQTLSSLYSWYVGRLFSNTQTTDFTRHLVQ